MDDLEQIRRNLAKIKELDEQMEEMKVEEERQRYNQANQIVDFENIELQLLLEEMEQQQEISRRLMEENQDLQRKLQAKKLQYDQTKEEIDAYSQSQNEMIERQRKRMEVEQNHEDMNSMKEEKRLKQTLELLQEKHAKLTDEKKILQAKLDHLKASMMPKKRTTTKKNK